MPTPRTWRRAGLAALAAVLLVALPAGAHPVVRGGEAPVDSVTTVVLAMAHGCGTEEAGGGDPTLEVALEVPDEVRVVDVADHPDYDHELEADEDGRVGTVTWTATEVGEPAPELELDAVFSGEVGDEVHLRVFQGCEGFAYRWIGTPDDPADDPAVRVTLVASDPDAPAPAPDEPTPAEVEVAEDDDPAAGEDAPEDDGVVDDLVDEDADTDAEAEADAGEVEGADDAAQEDVAGFPFLLFAAVALVLIGLGLVLARRMRSEGRGDATRDPGATSDPRP